MDGLTMNDRFLTVLDTFFWGTRAESIYDLHFEPMFIYALVLHRVKNGSADSMVHGERANTEERTEYIYNES